MRKTNHVHALAYALRARAARSIFWMGAARLLAAVALVPVKS